MRFSLFQKSRTCVGVALAAFGAFTIAAISSCIPHETGLAGAHAWTSRADSDSSPFCTVDPPGDESLVPWAWYFVAMHNRLHPIFTDREMAALDQGPPSDPRNDKALRTLLEIIIEPTGEIASVRVVGTVGSAGFDTIARESVIAAGPFPAPPAEIKSTDGRVYVHWELYRDRRVGCSARLARPRRAPTKTSNCPQNAEFAVPARVFETLRAERLSDPRIDAVLKEQDAYQDAIEARAADAGAPAASDASLGSILP